MEAVDLGLTGLRVSPLCFGTGTNGWNQRSNQGDLGRERLAYLLRFQLTADPASAVRYVLTQSAMQAIAMGMMNEDEVVENCGLVGQRTAVG